MSDERYRIVLTGYSSEKGEFYVEQDIAKLFKTTPERARQLLKRAPTKLKENLPVDEANRYRVAIERTGATCEVENMRYNISGLSIT